MLIFLSRLQFLFITLRLFYSENLNRIEGDRFRNGKMKRDIYLEIKISNESPDSLTSAEHEEKGDRERVHRNFAAF
jgi:hypothetical protein